MSVVVAAVRYWNVPHDEHDFEVSVAMLHVTVQKFVCRIWEIEYADISLFVRPMKAS